MQIFLKDIANNKPLYDDVVEMVLDVVCTTEASPKRDALEDNVNDAVRRWDILSKNAENRMRQLNRIEPLSAEYENTKHEFFRWLTDTESAIKEVPTDEVDQISLPKYLEQIKVGVVTFVLTEPLYFVHHYNWIALSILDFSS